MLKAIIFDFDGTIADTLPIYIDAYNDLAKKFRLKKIQPEDISRLKNKSMKDIFKSFHIPIFIVPLVVWRLKKDSRNEIHKSTLFPGILESISELDKKYDIFLLTSNSAGNVELFLEKYQIEPFKKIYSSNNFFDKSRKIHKLLKEQNLEKSEVVYVGDEVRDIESCKKAGIRIISVNWGFSTASLLESYEPDFLVNEPEEIVETIMKM